MKENKFLKLLKTLNQQELKAFHKYLNGLYGKQEKMIQLFNYFFNQLKKRRIVVLPTNDATYDTLFAKRQSVKVVGNLFADLYKYLEEFLRWQKINVDANNYEKDKLQIDIFKERGLDDWFYAKIERAKKNIIKSPHDMWNYLKLFELNHLTYFKFSTEKHKQDTSRLLSEALLNLDDFFIAAKLSYACEIQNKTHLNKTNSIDNWLLSYLLQKDLNKIEANPFLSIYFLIFQLLNNSNVNEYSRLKTEFIQNRHFFSVENQHIILTNLLNFITKKIREGDLEFKKEAFELYKIGVEDKISIINNEIGAVSFFNIINVACSLKETEWAEHFLKNYAIYLNNKDKEEIKKLARSIIYFEKKQFGEVLIQLRDINFKNIFYETRARALIIRSVIEQEMDKSIIQAECDAFSQSLRRNELLTDTSLTAYKNFVRLTRMIYVNTKTSKKQLLNFLDNEVLFVYKTWLLEKVDKFKEPS